MQALFAGEEKAVNRHLKADSVTSDSPLLLGCKQPLSLTILRRSITCVMAIYQQLSSAFSLLELIDHGRRPSVSSVGTNVLAEP
jgi:hypothetical protein